MKSLIKLIPALSLALASMNASAGLTYSDWKEVGDKMVSLDTDTGLEWLDLTVTDNQSYTQVSELLSTTYKGWRLPTYDEVNHMISSHLTDTRASFYNGLFGTTDYYRINDYSGYRYYSYGIHINAEGTGLAYSGIDAVPKLSNYTYKYYQYYSADFSAKADYKKGVYLVSDGGTTISSINNPEINANNPNSPYNVPIGGAVLALGLISLVSFRRNEALKCQ